jgi:hypothetical protein
MTDLRPALPELPEQMRGLPIDHRGYPVPWFVAWLDEDEKRCPVGEGKPEFRVMDQAKIGEAIRLHRCWVCGGRLGSHKAFTIGPMCVVNRVNAEPPSHRDCAIFSATACPFLSRPHARRREDNMPKETGELPGIAVMRNPGVACVYVTKDFTVSVLREGIMFNFAEPTEVLWYAQGREATRAEVEEAIDNGLPRLYQIAEENKDEREKRAIDKAVERMRTLLPAAD